MHDEKYETDLFVAKAYATEDPIPGDRVFTRGTLTRTLMPLSYALFGKLIAFSVLIALLSPVIHSMLKDIGTPRVKRTRALRGER